MEVIGNIRNQITKLISIIILHAGLTVIMICALYNHYISNTNNKNSKSNNKKKYNKESSSNIISHYDDGDDDNMTTKNKHNIPLINDKEHDILIPALSFYYNKLNIIVEEFQVMTPDGYPLALWHLKDMNVPHSTSKKPMLFIHGLLQSSASFASGGENSLAYYFNQNGFDVWLGNNRIGFQYETEKNQRDKNYWNWDMNEMYKIDLPTLIDFVQEKTGHERIHLVGHSQGTAEIFLALINNVEDIRSKVDTFIALSPACYPGSLILNDSKILKVMARTIDNPFVFGNKSFVKVMMLTRQWFLGTKFFGFVCYLFFSYLFDWNDELWERGKTARHFMFSPVYVSVKLMQWWLSTDPNKISFIQHSSTLLFPENKRWFDFTNSENAIFPKVFLVVPRKDRLVDGLRLIDHFNKFEDPRMFQYWILDEYSHLDVLWATTVQNRIGKPLLEALKSSGSQSVAASTSSVPAYHNSGMTILIDKEKKMITTN